MYIETRDIRHVKGKTLSRIKDLSYLDEGWMYFLINDLRGKGTVPKVYTRGLAFIARDRSKKIMGWALVRFPEKIVTGYATKYIHISKRSAGRRPDFMVYVDPDFRGKKVAKNLLFTAYNYCGKLDVYPHDDISENFYGKHRRLVVQHDTSDMIYIDYSLREVNG